jgi:tetratricopeptide (TPR) repeat protein
MQLDAALLCDIKRDTWAAQHDNHLLIYGSNAVATCHMLQALALKAQGNELYKSRKFDEAIEAYSKALELFDGDVSFLTNRCDLCHLERINIPIACLLGGTWLFLWSWVVCLVTGDKDLQLGEHLPKRLSVVQLSCCSSCGTCPGCR